MSDFTIHPPDCVAVFVAIVNFFAFSLETKDISNMEWVD